MTPEEVFARYRAMVYQLAFARTGSRSDADDILQDVFCRYLQAGVVFIEEEHRKAWLLRVAVNCCNSLMTSAWIKRVIPFHSRYAAGKLRAEIREKSDVFYAVMALPPAFRTTIHLYYYENYSVAEIAAILEQPEATVKTHLHRARRKLKDILSAENMMDEDFSADAEASAIDSEPQNGEKEHKEEQ